MLPGWIGQLQVEVEPTVLSDFPTNMESLRPLNSMRAKLSIWPHVAARLGVTVAQKLLAALLVSAIRWAGSADVGVGW